VEKELTDMENLSQRELELMMHVLERHTIKSREIQILYKKLYDQFFKNQKKVA
jgi:hypothetical protein